MTTERTNLTKEQTRKLLSLIKEHVTAQADLSWKGSTDPSTWEETELEAKRAERELRGYITSLARIEK